MTVRRHGPQSDEARELVRTVLQRAPDPNLRETIDALPAAPELRAGLHLANGEWERAHKLVQPLHTPAAAHWHALVHRHEGDFPNSKYWLRKAGRRAVYPRLAEAAREAGHGDLLTAEGAWDPLRFTDALARTPDVQWVTDLDALETRLLLETCLEMGSSA